MQTLRVKLNLPATDPPEAAQSTFETISEVHSDQAIFQVNQTQYLDADDWGFRVTYRSNDTFVQTTSLTQLERTMANVADNSFEQRVHSEGE